MSARKARSIAPTLRASLSPSPAPPAAASMTFACVFGRSTSRVPRVTGSAVSGMSILLTTIPAGAAMMLAASRWPAMSGNTPTSIAT